MLTDFELEQAEKEAKRLIQCTGCYGVGQKHVARPQDRWEICPVCQGLGRSIAEPQTLEMIAEIREWRAKAAALGENGG